MTNVDAITKGLVLMNRYRPSRHELTVRELGRLIRSRGIDKYVRQQLGKARQCVISGAPFHALATLERGTDQ